MKIGHLLNLRPKKKKGLFPVTRPTVSFWGRLKSFYWASGKKKSKSRPSLFEKKNKLNLKDAVGIIFKTEAVQKT